MLRDTQKRILRWFTLVELIVVITIVGILSTIGFVSYSGYLVWARDSNRLGQLANITEALQVFATSKRLPLPDSPINIIVGDPDTIVAYQWNAGVNVIDALDYNNGWRDPKDKTPFVYMVTKDRKSFQMLAFMEETWSLTQWIIPQAYAVNYEERFAKTYGSRLGILTSASTVPGVFNTPAHLMNGITSVDLVNTTDDYIAHISDLEKIEWKWSALRKASPVQSCKRIKQAGLGSNSTIYTINPSGAGDIEVYCDMETLGWGWTLIARSVAWWSGAFSWGNTTWTVQNLNAPYVLWDVAGLTYSEVMMTSYSIKRRVTGTSIADNSSVSSFSEWSHTLWVSGISWPALSGQGMFFVR